MRSSHLTPDMLATGCVACRIANGNKEDGSYNFESATIHQSIGEN